MDLKNSCQTLFPIQHDAVLQHLHYIGCKEQDAHSSRKENNTNNMKETNETGAGPGTSLGFFWQFLLSDTEQQIGQKLFKACEWNYSKKKPAPLKYGI